MPVKVLEDFEDPMRSLCGTQGGKILPEGSVRPRPGASHPGPSLVLLHEDNLNRFKTAPRTAGLSVQFPAPEGLRRNGIFWRGSVQ